MLSFKNITFFIVVAFMFSRISYADQSKIGQPLVVSLSLQGQKEKYTLSKKSKFQALTYNEDSQEKKLPNLLTYPKIQNVNKDLLVNDDYIRFSFAHLSPLSLEPSEHLKFFGTVEFAEQSVTIPQNSSLSIQKMLRLGFDTKNIYYEFPMNLGRRGNEYPTFLDVKGKVVLEPLTIPPSAKIHRELPHKSGYHNPVFESNLTHIRIDKDGLMVIGENKTPNSKGFFSKKGHLVFYNSSLMASKIESLEDEVDIIGQVLLKILAENQSIIKSNINFRTADSYHASELVNQENDTFLKLEGNFILEGKWVMDVGYHKEGILSLPKIYGTNLSDLSKISIDVSTVVLEMFQLNARDLFRNQKFLIIESLEEIKKLPKFISAHLPFLKLKLSEDKKNIFLIYSEN